LRAIILKYVFYIIILLQSYKKYTKYERNKAVYLQIPPKMAELFHFLIFIMLKTYKTAHKRDTKVRIYKISKQFQL